MGDAQKKRRLCRRDSDDQVERLISDRLKSFPAEVVESAVSSKGETVSNTWFDKFVYRCLCDVKLWFLLTREIGLVKTIYFCFLC